MGNSQVRHRDRHSASQSPEGDLTLPFLTHLHTTRTLFWHTAHAVPPYVPVPWGHHPVGSAGLGDSTLPPRPSANRGGSRTGPCRGTFLQQRAPLHRSPQHLPATVSGEEGVGWAPGLCLVSCVIRN